MTVSTELAGCRSGAKDAFASLFNGGDTEAVSKEVAECIKVMAQWTASLTQVQKSLSKEISRILTSKIQELKAVDVLLVSTKTVLHCIKESNQSVNPVIFELFASLLGLFLSFDRINGFELTEDSPTIHVRGIDLYDYFIDRLLTFKWRPENLIALTVMIRDLKGLSVKRTQSVIDKIVALLPQVSAEETPALFYQLLLLGRGNTEVTGMTKEAAQITVAVFQGIVGYFSTLESLGDDMESTEADRSMSSQSRKLESQCAMHIVLALKHNQWLANEFLKHVKKLIRGPIPRFALMILLSMTESFKFATLVPNLIKSNISTCLANLEIFTSHPDISGLQVENYERLEHSYQELVQGFTVEAESALKTLMKLALDMTSWNGSAFQKEKYAAVSKTILLAIFGSHKYARQELANRMVEHLCTHDEVSVAIQLDEFYQQDAKLVGGSIAARFPLLKHGKSWSRLAALTVKSGDDMIRRCLLSNDDDQITMSLDALKMALEQNPADYNIALLLRFAIDRLHHRKELFNCLQDLTRNDVITDYIVKKLLVQIANGGSAADWNWPEMISRSIDSQVGCITLHLPNLLLLLGKDDISETCIKSLLMTLDNQAGVRWFSETESIASQDLKRPMISDLYQSAILLSLTRGSPNIPRSFRLLNRQNDFMAGCANVFNSLLDVGQEQVGKAIEVILEDQFGTNGSDDLVKWLLSKLQSYKKINGNTTSVLEALLAIVIANESKLKPSFGLLLEALSKGKPIQVSDDYLKWAIHQKVPTKELIALVNLMTPSDSNVRLVSTITSNDASSAKHLFTWLLKSKQLAPPQMVQAARDALMLLGEIDADSPDENSFGNEHSLVHFKCINRKSLQATVVILLNWVLETIGHAEWILKMIKAQLKDEHFNKESISFLCRVLYPAIQVQVTLCLASIFGPASERLQLCLQKTYRFASLLCAFLMAVGKPYDLEPLKSLFDLMAGSLSPNIYTMIPLVQQMEAERAKEAFEVKRMKKAKSGRGSSLGSAKSARESKLLPGLIFNIEVFDKQILEMSRKGGVMLVNQIHRSTARDFRIHTEELEAALQNIQLEAISDNIKDEEADSDSLEEPLLANQSTTDPDSIL